ncbi:MAG: hypothetical protein ACRELZ_11725 [Candidatus Rokuibacteriota bacterium]
MTYRNPWAVLVAVVAVLGGLLAVSPVLAEGQGVLYDDFSSAQLDATKWIGFQVSAGGFSGSPLEITRKIRGGAGPLGGKLELSHRMVGGLTPSSGQESRNRLNLRDIAFVPGPTGPIANFAGVEFDVLPRRFETMGCPTPTAVPTRVRAGFNHQMFNDPALVNTGGSTGNVGAVVELRRNSTSPDRPRTIPAVGILYRCQNSDCTQTVSVTVDLGPVTRGDEVRLKTRWQPDLNGVSFQKNEEAPMFVSYAGAPFNVASALDELSNPIKPIGSFFKALDVVALAPACAEQPTEADITALFDNVVVLPLLP